MLACGRTSTTMVFSKKDRSDRSFFYYDHGLFMTMVKRPWSFWPWSYDHKRPVWPVFFLINGGRSLLNNAIHLSISCKLDIYLKLVWNPKPGISNKFCQILTFKLIVLKIKWKIIFFNSVYFHRGKKMIIFKAKFKIF